MSKHFLLNIVYRKYKKWKEKIFVLLIEFVSMTKRTPRTCSHLILRLIHQKKRGNLK